MRSVAEHQKVVADLVASQKATRVLLAEALGRVLASDQIAPISLPCFDNSAMDGYAVRAADVASANSENPVHLPVAEDIPAGRIDIPALEAGTAHRIMTGAPVPSGADAIVPVEATDGGTEIVTIRESRASGSHLRYAGEDVRTGQRVLAAGTVIGPAQIGLLAALGLTQVEVYPAMRVLVLSTGSELVEPGIELKPGQIYESNAPMLAAAITAAGATATVVRFVADNVEDFHAALETHLGEADLIVTTGGVSAGAYEVVKDALACEAVDFVKVAMQPGKPQGAGTYRGVPIVTFPGNPVSALVSFEVFLRGPLRAAMGFANTERPHLQATLMDTAVAPAGSRQFRRGRLAGDRVSLVGPPASHYLNALAATDCLVDIPADVVRLTAGDQITVWDLRES
ncbi:MAG TPA: gephyrin-like molybdotransferase Glp [Marmoricola sp.]|nr:gephyrin-like molybdotransferase Glp [Marmoricola sp.]